jgi:hypothetical protein
MRSLRRVHGLSRGLLPPTAERGWGTCARKSSTENPAPNRVVACMSKTFLALVLAGIAVLVTALMVLINLL